MSYISGSGGGGGGSGDVVGPASSTDNAVARFNGVTGKLIQNSGVIIDDSDAITGVTSLAVDNITINGNVISSTDTNGPITLTPDGSGTVNISYLTQYLLPVVGASGAINDLADGIGAANSVLMSNGAGAGPTWETAATIGAVTTLTGDTGGAISPTAGGNISLLGDTYIETAGSANTITASLSDNTLDTAVFAWDGCLLETPEVLVTSNGSTITLSIEKDGGGDLTAVFSDGFYTWDTTPADTVTLTAGSDTSPQINYVYFLQSTKTLTASTTGFPAAEHVAIATVLCQSAASLQTDGAYKVHEWTDHVTDTDEQGHITHINYWIRQQPATWDSGVTPTLTITPNVGTPDNVIFTSTAGVVLQLHDHDFPAFTGTPDIYVINDSGTPYNKVTDLNGELTDSTGASMSGRYFSLVIWGVVSEDAADCKLICNLPGGSYTNQTDLTTDPNRYADYSIPTVYKGTGFLIAELQLRHQTASGGTWTEIATVDLRGLEPSRAAGGSTVAPTEFIDNVFRILDEGDNTKKIAFQASGITTATTRTITMADRNVDLSNVAEGFDGDSGTATPASGTLTVAGGTNMTTAAATSTVTINLDDAITLATSVSSPLYTVSSGDLVLNMTDDAGTNSVSFTNNSDAEVAYIDSLGAASFTDLDVDNININGNTIISTNTNGDITLTPNGTGQVNISYLTQYTLPIAGASGAVDDLADGLGTSGQVLTSNGAGAEPTWEDAAAGGITWNVETGATKTADVNNGYFANYNGTLAFTLPSTAAVGDTIEICQMYAGQGFTIAVNTGETIYIGNTNTTITTGTLASTDDGDWIELVCRVANTDWQANVKSGNISIT